MARLAESVIEQIKQEISLVRLVESQGHQLKKHGKDYALNCPFHEDKTASLIITPKSNLWHCMGACNAGGSVIDWVMKSQGVSFRFASTLPGRSAISSSLAGYYSTRGYSQSGSPAISISLGQWSSKWIPKKRLKTKGCTR